MAPKTSVMKKPSAIVKDSGVTKKPATNTTGDEKVTHSGVVTEVALQRLNGASDAKVQDYLDTLGDAEQQKLWKKFEQSRKEENANDDYKKYTQGTAGGKKVARALLKMWIKGGRSTKTTVYEELTAQVAERTSRGTKEEWQPLHYMLQHRYGPRQLKAMVTAGTVSIRKNPRDPRFPEFLDCSDFTHQSTERLRAKMAQVKGRAEWDDFDSLANLAITDGGQQLKILQPEDASDEDMAKFALGKKSKISDETDDEPAASPKPSSKKPVLKSTMTAISDSSAILKSVEEAVNIVNTKNIDEKKLRLSVVRAKAACNSAKDMLEHNIVADPKFEKKAGAKVKELKQLVIAMEKAGQRRSDAKVAKELVTKAAKAAKSCSKLLDVQ